MDTKKRKKPKLVHTVLVYLCYKNTTSFSLSLPLCMGFWVFEQCQKIKKRNFEVHKLLGTKQVARNWHNCIHIYINIYVKLYIKNIYKNISATFQLTRFKIQPNKQLFVTTNSTFLLLPLLLCWFHFFPITPRKIGPYCCLSFANMRRASWRTNMWCERVCVCVCVPLFVWALLQKKWNETTKTTTATAAGYGCRCPCAKKHTL